MTIASAALFITTGILTGGVYFVLLYSSVLQHVGQARWWSPLSLHLVRVALVLTGFWWVAQRGAIPLLLCLAGFLIARLWTVRRLGVT